MRRRGLTYPSLLLGELSEHAVFVRKGAGDSWVDLLLYTSQLHNDTELLARCNALDFQVTSFLALRLVLRLCSETFLVIFARSRVFCRLEVSVGSAYSQQHGQRIERTLPDSRHVDDSGCVGVRREREYTHTRLR